MRYNGVEARAIHRAIRIGHQAPPGRRREPLTIETARKPLLADWKTEAMEIHATISIAARSPREGEEAYLALCNWARGGGGLHPLEPTWLPGMAYNAALQEVTEPDWRRGFGTAEVVWLVPDPHPYSIVPDMTRVASGTELSLRIGGTAETDIVIEVTPEESQSDFALELDGVAFFGWMGTLAAGSTMKIDMAKGTVLVDGGLPAGVVDYTSTDFDRQLAPGVHRIECGFTAEIKARWHKRWA